MFTRQQSVAEFVDASGMFAGVSSGPGDRQTNLLLESFKNIPLPIWSQRLIRRR